jgi:D-arabinose 1-dehydrogenase-like Zn-dependent alcohol dehydrogenase
MTDRLTLTRALEGSGMQSQAAEVYPLARANDALADLRKGALQGAAVLVP